MSPTDDQVEAGAEAMLAAEPAIMGMLPTSVRRSIARAALTAALARPAEGDDEWRQAIPELCEWLIAESDRRERGGYGNAAKRLRDAEQCIALLLASPPAAGTGWQETMLELANAAEHDMHLNQGGDSHTGGAESSGGWWSLKTENAIRAARQLLSTSRPAQAEDGKHVYDAALGTITAQDREYAADLAGDISEALAAQDAVFPDEVTGLVAEWFRKVRYEAVMADRAARLTDIKQPEE